MSTREAQTRKRKIRKLDRQKMINIRKKQKRESDNRRWQIFHYYVEPTIPWDRLYSLPKDFDYSLSPHISKLPMTFIEWDSNSRNVDLHTQLHMQMSVIRYIITDIVPLPLVLCSLVQEYVPSILAFHLADKDEETKRAMLTEWMLFLSRENKPFDSRWGCILLGDGSAVKLTHAKYRHDFDLVSYGNSTEWTQQVYSPELSFNYRDGFPDRSSEMRKVIQKLVELTSHFCLFLIPLLLDKETLSPLRIVYKNRKNVINVCPTIQ